MNILQTAFLITAIFFPNLYLYVHWDNEHINEKPEFKFFKEVMIIADGILFVILFVSIFTILGDHRL